MHIISPLFDLGYNHQEKVGDVKFKQVSGNHQGLWYPQCCAQVTTFLLHIENDCSYTLITVPKQRKKELTCVFLFKIDEKRHIDFPMIQHVSFMYSTNFLTYCQHSVGTSPYPFFIIYS